MDSRAIERVDIGFCIASLLWALLELFLEYHHYFHYGCFQLVFSIDITFNIASSYCYGTMVVIEHINAYGWLSKLWSLFGCLV